MIETLFGGVLGGIFRIAPELMKLFDRANERKHEVTMLQAEMEFAKIKGEIAMRQVEAQMTVAELDAMTEAIKEQGQTARAAGKFVAGISALVRPGVTWAFVIVYFLVKLASYFLALEQNGDWKTVLVAMWTDDDQAMLMLILTFWFVGRIYERGK